MSKKLNDWLDEFVENGADASDVTEWPSNAGGGSGGIGFKDKCEITIDLNADSFPINNNNWDYIGNFYNIGGFVQIQNDIVTTNWVSASPFDLYLILEKNEANNQILAYLTGHGASDYQSISNVVVVYEGDVTDIQDTSELSNLPTVTFIIENSDYNNSILYKDSGSSEIKAGISIKY